MLTSPRETAGADNSAVRLITLDPGHFHAALFQKEMLTGVSPRVHIYAPEGPDLTAHLARINAFNARTDNPTSWTLAVHSGPDYFPRLIAERPGNVVVLSGNNRGKIARMEALVRAGLHVLADKPWIIEPGDLAALEKTLEVAREQRVIAYDAMTQRYEITCLLQRELVNDAAVFGTCEKGSLDVPAVYMQSVHFLKKEVAGAPLLRPPWFFDPHQQGEPLADVGTHLVDLVQWMLSPERPIDYPCDISVLRGQRSAIRLSREQFKAVTGLADFPSYLAASVRGGALAYFGGNSVSYTLRGVHVKLDALWDYEAPPGGKDTELATFRGSRSTVEVRQGRPENFVPEVFVIPNRPADHAAVAAALHARLRALSPQFAGLAMRADGAGFRIVIPSNLRVSHEAHFALLVRQFLAYRQQPHTLPEWEPSFLAAKYFVTTEGVRLARQASAMTQTAMTR
jgi:predicted dehydrogenase